MPPGNWWAVPTLLGSNLPDMSPTSTLLQNTLLLAAATCAVSVPLGVCLAWLLQRTDLPGRQAGKRLLTLLLFVPLYLQVAAWQAGFGLQGWHTLARAETPWLDGWTGAIWIHAMAAVPWVVLIVGAAFRLVEPELEEQALLDGSPRQVFFRVTLPAVGPAIAAATLWVAVTTAGEMTVTDLLGIRTYAEEVYTQIAIGQGPRAASLGLVPGIAGVATILTLGMIFAARLSPWGRPWTARPCRIFPTGRWRLPLALVAAAMVLILAGVPLGNLLAKAGVLVEQTATGRERTWSAAKCLTMVASAPWRCPREIGWSLLIGGLSATAAVAAAFPLAWLARRGHWRAVPAMLTAAICLAVPGPLVGLAIIGLLDRPELPPLVYLYDHSILAPWLALTIRSLPAAILVLGHALRTLPQDMLDNAAIDGAGPIALIMRIALPERRAAIALAWLVALAVALADLATSILVVPPGVTTLSIHVFGLLHYGVEDRVAGICLAMVALFAFVAAAAGWLADRSP